MSWVTLVVALSITNLWWYSFFMAYRKRTYELFDKAIEALDAAQTRRTK